MWYLVWCSFAWIIAPGIVVWVWSGQVTRQMLREREQRLKDDAEREAECQEELRKRGFL